MRNVLAFLFCFAAMEVSSANKPSHFFCTFANGQKLEGLALNGEIMLDFDNKGSWNAAFGKVDGNMVTITLIVAGGRFVMAWNVDTHEAYAITDHNRTGKRVENHAYCWWR